MKTVDQGDREPIGVGANKTKEERIVQREKFEFRVKLMRGVVEE